MSPYASAYHDLLRTLRELKAKFIRPFVPAQPQTQPSDYEYEVKAYCLLAHAAIEECAERIVLEVSDQSKDHWILHGNLSRIAASMIAFYGAVSEIEADDTKTSTKCFDRLRKVLTQLHHRFSEDVDKNHGIAIKYLRRILYPVAIDLPDDANLANSLDKLTFARGTFAHETAKHPLSPEDAAKYVYDCAQICRQIADQAISLVAAIP